MTFLSLLLLLFVAGATFHASRAQGGNVTVTADNALINYVGSWIVQDDGGHKYASGPGCSLSLTFQGTAIYWNSAHNPNGGIGRVSVDGEDPVDVDESVGTEVGEASVEATLWGKTGLDGSVNHTFELAYTADDTTGSSVSSSSSSPATSPAASPATSPAASPASNGIVPSPSSSSASDGIAPSSPGGGTSTFETSGTSPAPSPSSTVVGANSHSASGCSNKTALVGGVVGGVLGGLLLALVCTILAFWISRRRRRIREEKKRIDEEHRANPYRKHRDMSAPSLRPSSDAYTSPHTLVNSHVPTASYQSSSEPLSSTPPLSIIHIPAPQRAWDTLAPLPASSVLDSSDAQSAITTADASLIGSSFSPRTPPPMYVEMG
ncbi:hypothetical protein IEO21_05586 [Rhodonia placenta]|uniref:Uncharacterized protein n=1 Tax=Rhodonia placenta TaxID=104341 RepID=A0A8H7P1X0_9APHY|nr:hypothetical protein IEO21_05586 [Postia placenta]